MSFLLTEEQLATAAGALEQGKLSAAHIDDLLAVFRGYLGGLAVNYSIRSTFEAEDDDDGLGRRRCEKLVACLSLFQENQFTPESGFAPTAANRTGFIYSMDGEVFEIFKYAFCLFWDWPAEFGNKFQPSRGVRKSLQGTFVNTGQ